MKEIDLTLQTYTNVKTVCSCIAATYVSCLELLVNSLDMAQLISFVGCF